MAFNRFLSSQSPRLYSNFCMAQTGALQQGRAVEGQGMVSLFRPNINYVIISCRSGADNHISFLCQIFLAWAAGRFSAFCGADKSTASTVGERFCLRPSLRLRVAAPSGGGSPPLSECFGGRFLEGCGPARGLPCRPSKKFFSDFSTEPAHFLRFTAGIFPLTRLLTTISGSIFASYTVLFD